jgi:hypothetical protein
MLVGHYGPAFVLKTANPKIPLWVLFVAVQWMDVLWSVFVYLGIERFRVVPGFTASNNLDLYYMPITHSLPGAAILSVLLGAIVAFCFKGARGKIFAVVAAAVFSHWLLDVIVHVRDLALWDDSDKVGFGLWNYFWPALILEFAVLVGGAWWYARAMPNVRPRGDMALWLFVGFMMLLYLGIRSASAEPGATGLVAAELFTVYVVLAGLAALVERLRQ